MERGFEVIMMRSLSDSSDSSSAAYGSEEEVVIRKGPWTEEEDSVLMNYITLHGEGHWNSLARSAGLRRTGKSCRLRWLNYLRPNVRRGNITLQEQFLILDLHSRWGNRWSKIAEQLPGRTDNEIKNYWRTRVVKQARQLKCDVNSKEFRDTLRFVWMPRLMERIQAQTQSSGPTSQVSLQPPPSLSESTTVSAEEKAFELANGFGDADLWTDENIWFLQQQLADDF